MTTNDDILSDASVNITSIKSGITINSVATLLKDIEKLHAYVKFSVPESRDDKNFKRELLRTVVDIDKLFKGVATNFIAKSMIEFGKGINFERKFPIKKVDASNSSFNQTDSFIFTDRESFGSQT